MAELLRVAPADDLVDRDQRVSLHGACWQDYDRLLRIRGERRVPRITYLAGEIELVSPSERHEVAAWQIGWLLGCWMLELGLRWEALGATTLRDAATERGAEADESFSFGNEPKDRPDLAIEVVVTAGGIDKLEVYRGLGVPEVWFWRDGRIAVHVLRGDRYESSTASAALPAVDVALLARLVDRRDPARAARLLRGILARRARRGPVTGS